MIEVESDEEILGEMYKRLACEILSEARLSSVKDLFIRIEAKQGYFISSMNMRKGFESLKISGCSRLEESEEGVKITVDPSQEQYFPDLLNTLYNALGGERITQTSRYEILAKNTKIHEIENLVVVDCSKQAQTVATDLLVWLMPEGFRVATTMINNETVSLLCSQYDLREAWIKEMRRIHEKIVNRNI
ncbi:MAG: methanogenesis marker 17 protein [Thermoproteota archaeon]